MDKSNQAVSVFNKRAQDYQSRYMDIGAYHDTLDAFCRELPQNAQIFELACGPGNITRYLLDKRPDLKFTATDLAPNMISLARVNNPEAEFLLMDMRAINTSNRYDAVVCGFGLPYLSKDEAVAFIAKLPGIILPRGLVYLSTMEGDYNASSVRKSSDGADEIFIHLHQARYLTDALSAAGFEIMLQKEQEFPANADTDLILIARYVS